jgi:HK97 gp10 family phage protein
MATELRIDGLDEFLAELERLAPELTAEARSEQAQEAERIAANLRAAYPIVTGELRNSVQVARASSTSPHRVFTRIAVTARHAAFYEFGTHRTEPHPTFTPIVRRGREAFLLEIIERVKARGLEVNGGPANA